MFPCKLHYLGLETKLVNLVLVILYPRTPFTDTLSPIKSLSCCPRYGPGPKETWSICLLYIDQVCPPRNDKDEQTTNILNPKTSISSITTRKMLNSGDVHVTRCMCKVAKVRRPSFVREKWPRVLYWPPI